MPDTALFTCFGAQTFTNLGFIIGPWLVGYLLQEYGGTALFLIIEAISVTSIWFCRAGEITHEVARSLS